jgi:hypothetical protein
MQVLELADEYRRAAENLMTTGRKGKPLSRAPYRLAAIHAIELYLNAFLMTCGKSSSTLRGLHHDLRRRREYAREAGLSLKRKTAEHLDAVSDAREYLVMRYGPEMSGKVSHLNRMGATLNEVAKKVSKHLGTTT